MYKTGGSRRYPHLLRCRCSEGSGLSDTGQQSLNQHPLIQRAVVTLPGGVNSPVRSFAAVGSDPLVAAHGRGAYLFDVNGKKYIDFVQSWGALIFGHAYPPIIEAANRAISNGTSFGLLTEGEVELAERIVEMVPSVEKVRLVNSGTEATMTAVRLSRGFTNRDLIVKFEGCYHGHSDALLASAGSGVATLGLAGSAGVPKGSVADTVVLPYNDEEAVEQLFLSDGELIAAVIVEPVAANMGLIPPAEGFLETLRRVTSQHGALLIFDEVITGFRLGRGGAQDKFNVMPDLTTLGKVLGGGFPIAALGGRAEIMDALAPLGPVYQAGTLAGNPVAVAAAIAVLDNLDPAVYTMLEGRVSLLANELEPIFEEAGLPVAIQTCGTLMSIFFKDAPPSDYRTAKACDACAYKTFFIEMLDRGVLLPPSPMESMFVSVAHERDELEKMIDSAHSAAIAAARIASSTN
ncbi:MAG: glutamate-1-semialdehyde-2,1-aminomutase [Acidimicrobiia bacterium]